MLVRVPPINRPTTILVNEMDLGVWPIRQFTQGDQLYNRRHFYIADLPTYNYFGMPSFDSRRRVLAVQDRYGWRGGDMREKELLEYFDRPYNGFFVDHWDEIDARFVTVKFCQILIEEQCVVTATTALEEVYDEMVDTLPVRVFCQLQMPKNQGVPGAKFPKELLRQLKCFLV